MSQTFVRSFEGREFRFRADLVSIKVAASDTRGRYSSMLYVVGPGSSAVPHLHQNFDETFYVLSGTLKVLVGDLEREVSSGDFIRVPLNTRHGFKNATDSPVEMFVMFAPGGIEELFYTYRTEKPADFALQAYLADAAGRYHTHYERPSK